MVKELLFEVGTRRAGDAVGSLTTGKRSLVKRWCLSRE
jgi:hypothetical protein